METQTVVRPGILRRFMFPMELLLWAVLLLGAFRNFQQMGPVYAELGVKLPALTIFWINITGLLHNFPFVLILPICFWFAITAVWLIGRLNVNLIAVVELVFRFVLMGVLSSLLVGLSLPLGDCCAVIR